MTTHTSPIHNVEFDALYLIDVMLLVDPKYMLYSTLTMLCKPRKKCCHGNHVLEKCATLYCNHTYIIFILEKKYSVSINNHHESRSNMLDCYLLEMNKRLSIYTLTYIQ